MTEEIIMNLIVNSGNASSLAIKAVHAARNNDFETADQMLQESSEASNKAHKIQTDLIQADLADDNKIEINLLIMHAQDHLMNAITVNTLSNELVEILRANSLKKGE